MIRGHNTSGGTLSVVVDGYLELEMTPYFCVFTDTVQYLQYILYESSPIRTGVFFLTDHCRLDLKGPTPPQTTRLFPFFLPVHVNIPRLPGPSQGPHSTPYPLNTSQYVLKDSYSL